ncbi:MAG: pilus assembly PilX N-terminal domain-containing protein [Rubrivivax sp.]|nr:pilus assembly PilX N-terminal domain-containing protein [Rubrivivax sp.]
MKPNGAGSRLKRQRGAATLVVVMVLFFIVSLVAAYTNRNLIFEQRTSANQYRSTQALEAAEAGLEWAVTMLNFSRIDASCSKSSTLVHGSFRERYITTDPVTGKFTPVAIAAGRDFPTCVWNGVGGWDCACPDAGLAALTPPTGAAVAPAFRVRLRAVVGDPATPTVPKQPGLIWVDVVGCTRLDEAGSANPCLSFTGQGALNEGRVVVSTMLALGGSASGMPLAALTVRGSVDAAGGALNVYNGGAGTSGLTVHASGAINPAGLTTRGPPGTPWILTQAPGDLKLAPASAGTTGAQPIGEFDRSFASIFNMRPEVFRDQQAAVRLACGTTPGCSASTFHTMIERNPGRPLWLDGNLVVDSALQIGTPGQPVLLTVNGTLTFTTPGSINGLVYLRLPRPAVSTWATSGTGRINGALIVDGDVVGSGNTTVVYDSAILQQVRYGSGSFVRVPGSWRDFQ